MGTTSTSTTPSQAREYAPWELLAYLLIGTFFGIVLIKSEVVSWFRIQEMFRFHSFHMYGVLGSAVATAALTLWLAGKLGWRSLTGAEIRIAAKRWDEGARHRYWIGGTLFGLGWGLAGTCPGPIYALIGYGAGGALVVLLAALLGTRAYAAILHKLPH
ncbi:MAG: DUF6691 family protein [Acidobacteriota bacterium]